MKETVTYLIKLKDAPLTCISLIKPSANFPTIKYSTSSGDAKDFDGLDKTVIDMTKHIAIKKTVTETTKFEEVEYD